MVQLLPAAQGCGNDKLVDSTNYFRSKWEHDPEQGQSQNEQKRAEDASAAGYFTLDSSKRLSITIYIPLSLLIYKHTVYRFVQSTNSGIADHCKTLTIKSVGL